MRGEARWRPAPRLGALVRTPDLRRPTPPYSDWSSRSPTAASCWLSCEPQMFACSPPGVCHKLHYRFPTASPLPPERGGLAGLAAPRRVTRVRCTARPQLELDRVPKTISELWTWRIKSRWNMLKKNIEVVEINVEIALKFVEIYTVEIRWKSYLIHGRCCNMFIETPLKYCKIFAVFLTLSTTLMKLNPN